MHMWPIKYENNQALGQKMNTPSNDSSIKVLVTRPEPQAQGLCLALEESGATALAFPVIEITSPQDSAPLQKIFQELEHYDWLIFISKNAVEYAFDHLKKSNITIPDQCRIAAIGKSTANKLQELNIKALIAPADRSDSEALLAMPELSDVAEKRILIIRGEGGRETLAETLRKRDANVEYAAVYRRIKPNKKLTHKPDIAIITSNEGLDNLWQMTNKKQHVWLKNLPLVVMSERNRQHAKQLGYHGKITIAAQQSDEGLLAAVKQWQENQQPKVEIMADKKEVTPKVEKKTDPVSKTAGQSLPPATKKPTHIKSTSPLLIAGLLAVTLGTSAGGYHLWNDMQHLESQLTQRIDSENNKLLKQIETLKQTQKNNQQINQQKLALADQQRNKLEKENGLLWKNQRAMQQQSGYDKRPWQMAESAYLLRLANHRLQLEDDIEGAIIGLQSADQILKAIADPALLSTREQLARELTQLKMLEQVDHDGLSAQLISLAESIRHLPIQGIEIIELQRLVEKEAAADVEEWQSVIDRVWSEMRSLVVITRNDKPVAPLIPADQQSYLYHNIELQLESARLALLKGDQKIWSASLAFAKNWLYDYFDHDKAAVKNSLELLHQLEKLNVSPELPDISAALRLLEKQREKLLTNNTNNSVITPENSL